MSGIHAALQHVGRIGNPPYILRFFITFSFFLLRFRLLGGAPSSVPILNAFPSFTTTEKISDHNSDYKQK